MTQILEMTVRFWENLTVCVYSILIYQLVWIVELPNIVWYSLVRKVRQAIPKQGKWSNHETNQKL